MNAMNRYVSLASLLLSATGCGGAEMQAMEPESQAEAPLEAEAAPTSEEVSSLTVSPTYARVVTLKVKRSGLCLDVGNNPDERGANVRQYPCHSSDNQQFQLVGAGGGYAKFINIASGMCLEMHGNSEPRLKQYPCDGGHNQEFRLRAEGGYYQFIVHDSGKCVEAEDSYPLPEAPIREASCKEIPKQEFKIKPLW